jgi:hypothetical protein
LLANIPLEKNESGLITCTERKEMPMEHRNWSGTRNGLAGGERPELLSREVFSRRQQTVGRHGKRLRRWLRILSNGSLSRWPYVLKTE